MPADDLTSPAPASDSPSDQELVALVNRGDANAFEMLYQRYRDWVVNLAHRFTGSEDLALDVLQETFLYFLRKFPGFELRANLKTFL
jgi:RNA polymerase sigma-70 factor (ECF subfamily)